MLGLASARRIAMAASLAAAILAFAPVTPSRAATVVLPFDFTSGLPTTVASIVGTGGTMSFTLDVGDPTLSNVFGDFAMDFKRLDNSSIGSVSLVGAPFIDGPSQILGDASLNPSGGLPNVSTWFLNVGPSDLPLFLVVTSTLNSFGDPFTPVLTVDFTGDIQATPLPGSFALFLSALGAGGIAMRRRQRKTHSR